MPPPQFFPPMGDHATTMRAARAVFLDAASLGDGLDLTPLAAAADAFTARPVTRPDEVVACLADANVAICNKTPIDEAAFAALPRLELVLATATGVNNIDLTAAALRGVSVCNCRDYGTAAVAQHAMLLLLALHTRFLDYRDQVRAGAWQRAETFCLMDFPILELAGRTLGVVGQGAIGSEVARLARAFGMTVVFARLPGRPAHADALPWREFLMRIDAVSLHCPLTDGTRHLIDAAALAAMKPGAFLINTARAGLVDANALIAALRSGHLAGAAQDGLDIEPPRGGHALLAPDIPRLIITPHNAWASRQARQRLVLQTAENLLAWRRGETLRTILAGH